MSRGGPYRGTYPRIQGYPRMARLGRRWRARGTPDPERQTPNAKRRTPHFKPKRIGPGRQARRGVNHTWVPFRGYRGTDSTLQGNLSEDTGAPEDAAPGEEVARARGGCLGWSLSLFPSLMEREWGWEAATGCAVVHHAEGDIA